MASTTSRHTAHDLVGVYLNDHLADATAGVELARRMAASAEPESEAADTLRKLTGEIAADRNALSEIMPALGVPLRG